MFLCNFLSRAHVLAVEWGGSATKRACTLWACPGTEAEAEGKTGADGADPALRARPARSRPARPARGAKARIQTARGRLFIGVWKEGWGAEHVQPIEPSGSKTLQRRHVRGRARHFVRRYGAGRHVVDAGEDGHCWRDCLDVECCAMGLGGHVHWLHWREEAWGDASFSSFPTAACAGTVARDGPWSELCLAAGGLHLARARWGRQPEHQAQRNVA